MCVSARPRPGLEARDHSPATLAGLDTSPHQLLHTPVDVSGYGTGTPKRNKTSTKQKPTLKTMTRCPRVPCASTVSELLGRRVVEAALSRVTALQPCFIFTVGGDVGWLALALGFAATRNLEIVTRSSSRAAV